ncbi:hypothetical protein QOT17_023990 [Balamuthia mandrillaris]
MLTRGLLLRRSFSTVHHPSPASLLARVKELSAGVNTDKDNYVDEGGVIYLSTKGWTVDDVQSARTDLMDHYHVMNCHTFKRMRLEPLSNEKHSEVRKMYPLPFDGFQQENKK